MFLLCRYEVNFQDGIDCGGAYVKLLSKSDDLNLVCSNWESGIWLDVFSYWEKNPQNSGYLHLPVV